MGKRPKGEKPGGEKTKRGKDLAPYPVPFTFPAPVAPSGHEFGVGTLQPLPKINQLDLPKRRLAQTKNAVRISDLLNISLK